MKIWQKMLKNCHHFSRFSLIFSLATSCAVGITVPACTPVLTEAHGVKGGHALEILKQLDVIDLALEEAAHHLCKKDTKKSQKRLDDIRFMRDFITDIQHASFAQPGTVDEPLLLQINDTLLKQLATVQKKKRYRINRQALEELRSTKATPQDTFLHANHAKRSALITTNKSRLKTIRRKTREYGLTPFNIFMRKATKVIKENKLSRAWPYLALYGLYRGRPLIDKIFADGSDTESAPAESGGKGKKKCPQSYSCFRDFFNITINPVITLSLGTLIGPTITEDAKSIGKWCKKQGKKALNFVSGKPYEEEIKVSKKKFKDIHGFEHAKERLTLLVDSFADSSLSADDINHGYLLAGPVDIGKQLLEAAAGEITAHLKKKTPGATCGVYSFHASTLLDKSVKDVLQEAQDFATKGSVCMIIIEDLDWLYHLLQDDPSNDPKLWASVINKLAPIVKKSKKSLYVAATIDNRDFVGPIAKDFGAAGTTMIHFSTPTAAERHAYFEHHLIKHAINPRNFTLDQWVDQTADCAHESLKSVMKHAFAFAHQEGTALKNRHVERALDTVIHGISYQTGLTPEANPQLRTAHIAGKALAHILVLPKTTLIKATTFPINHESGRDADGLITQPVDKQQLTSDTLEKECMIALAGPTAEQLLHGTYSLHRDEQVQQDVFDRLKTLYFPRAHQELMPDAVKQETLQRMWHTIDMWKQYIRELLTQHKMVLAEITHHLQTEGMITSATIKKLLANETDPEPNLELEPTQEDGGNR